MSEILKKAVFGTWVYYLNDEGKARWKCSECGKVCRRNPHDKLYCSTCGSRNHLES
jgi:Zn finger protein HypA/HybF involved in hydrogenase expression